VNSFFGLIGPSGVALLLGFMAVASILHILFRKPNLHFTGALVGLVGGLLVLILMPVYTDSQMPPIMLQLIPVACIVAVCAMMPLKPAAVHSICMALFAIGLHQAWMGGAFRGYMNHPRGNERYAKQDLRKMKSEFQYIFANTDSKEPLKAGYLDEAPYIDDMPKSLYMLRRVVAVPEWHTPLTGLYRNNSVHIRLWTPGGTRDQAVEGIKAIDAEPMTY